MLTIRIALCGAILCQALSAGATPIIAVRNYLGYVGCGISGGYTYQHARSYVRDLYDTEVEATNIVKQHKTSCRVLNRFSAPLMLGRFLANRQIDFTQRKQKLPDWKTLPCPSCRKEVQQLSKDLEKWWL